jgi:uncharacterized protein YceH (UPF0502 family)
VRELYLWMMENNYTTLPVLDEEEVRILGALMEKSRTTPEYYPLSVNALTAACNQKTSRRPVVNYDEQTVMLTLDRLKKKGMVSTATGCSSRTVKYKHNIALHFQLMPADIAIVCLLLLRGPQTPGEINTNSGKLHEFESLEEVQSVIEQLSDAPLPFVKPLPRQPGQKEVRYIHLFAPFNEALYESQNMAAPASNNMELENRVTQLELELAELKEAFNNLMKELM